MKVNLIILTILLSALFISGTIYAQEFPGKNREKRTMQFKEQLKDRLNLTDEQMDKIETLRFSNQKEMIDLRANLEKKQVELAELKNTINFSRDAYLNKINEIIAAKNKIEIARANHQMDVYQLLTDQQKKDWVKMTDRMHDRKHREVRKMRFMNPE
ncbi:MAG: Spy/CpxP family protein refolding chaperone [Ignavibacteriaceae bacterium]